MKAKSPGEGVNSLSSLLDDRNQERMSRNDEPLVDVPQVRDFVRQRRERLSFPKSRTRMDLLRMWWSFRRGVFHPQWALLTLGDVLLRNDFITAGRLEDDEVLEIDVRREIILRSIEELNLVETRLIGDHPDLFSAVDRLRSEGEFRLAIIPPLLCAVLILALQVHFLFSGVLLAVLMFFRQAIAREEEAGDLLADALLLGRVEVPIFEKLGLTANR